MSDELQLSEDQKFLMQAVKDATTPDPVPNAPSPMEPDKRSQTINPVHMAFKRALLPVLLENTKAIRPVKLASAPVIKPEHTKFIEQARIRFSGSDQNWQDMFGIIYDHMTQSAPGTGVAIIRGKKGGSNIFGPLTVCVPTRKNGSPYMLNMPHIVLRVDGGAVYCVTDNGASDASAMDVEKAGVKPATDDEIFAVVEGLNAPQLAEMFVHQYFRPVMHAVMGIEVDGDDEESDDVQF